MCDLIVNQQRAEEMQRQSLKRCGEKDCKAPECEVCLEIEGKFKGKKGKW